MWNRRYRTAAVVSSVVAMHVLAFLMWETRFSYAPSKRLLAIAIAIRAAAALVAWRGWAAVMIAVGAVAFWPVGFYLLGSPSPYAAVGIADLVYLASAVALLFVRPAGRPTRLA